MYEQMAQIKKYILDSYDYGELGKLSKKPSATYIE